MSFDLGLGGSATKTTSNNKIDTTETSQLKIDEQGILKFINDALTSEQGLAAIFSEEQVAGLFDSTTAKQGTEDLFAKIAGELGKLTGTTTSTKKGFESGTTREKGGNFSISASN